MPAYLLNNHAVSGQAEMPENNANHPFVSGQGPRIKRSPKPPPPATIAHAQAAIWHTIAMERRIARCRRGSRGEVLNPPTLATSRDFVIGNERVDDGPHRVRVGAENGNDLLTALSGMCPYEGDLAGRGQADETDPRDPTLATEVRRVARLAVRHQGFDVDTHTWHSFIEGVSKPKQHSRQ